MKLSKRDLYADIVEVCIDNCIELKLLHRRTFGGCSGSFDTNVLISCFRSEHALSTLVHESCHVDQFLDKNSIWFSRHNNIDEDVWDVSWADVQPRRYLNAFKHLCEVEIDCDVRAISKIKKYNLDININEYIAQSNCYHASYYYFHKYRCFYSSQHIPWDNYNIVKLFDVGEILSFDKVWTKNPALGDYITKYNAPL